MTKEEEAIKNIKEHCYFANLNPKAKKALDFAVKALEQETKTIQEKQAESEKYQKAFDDGYANGYAQARFDYEPKTDVLDRIRAEIIELRSRQNVGVLECLDIIDKYKVESEE